MFADNLKKSILQAAIQGKLTEQLPTDGNASDLLAQIQAEKLRLVKEKKIKSSESLPPISDDEIPFDIPQNWCWVRLGNICKLITKGSSPKWQGINYANEGILFITSENVGCERLILNKEKYVETKFNTLHSSSILQFGDVLTNIVGASIGRTAEFNLDTLANINQAVALIRLIDNALSKYIVKYLNSPDAYKIMMNDKVDTARANINLTNIANFLVPLPPFPEQKRIVEKVEKILAEIEPLAEAENELEQLENNFPKRLKASLLQAAIQGKLSEQLPTDGDARQLLHDIQLERQKLIKQKKIKAETLPPISTDEIPFDIPENWCWCRLGDIFDVRDGTHDTPRYTATGIPLVTSKNLIDGKIDFSTAKFISSKDAEKINMRSKVEIGDVLFAMIGTIGNPVLIEQKKEFCIKNMALFKALNSKYFCMKFLLLFLQHEQRIMKNFSSGGVQSFVSLKFLRNFLFPLPPLAEQKRIVGRLEALFQEI